MGRVFWLKHFFINTYEGKDYSGSSTTWMGVDSLVVGREKKCALALPTIFSNCLYLRHGRGSPICSNPTTKWSLAVGFELVFVGPTHALAACPLLMKDPATT